MDPAGATDWPQNKPFEPGVDDVPVAYYVCPATEWALGIVFLPRAVALYEIKHEQTPQLLSTAALTQLISIPDTALGEDHIYHRYTHVLAASAKGFSFNDVASTPEFPRGGPQAFLSPPIARQPELFYCEPSDDFGVRR
jgi:hypothetical protein